MARYKLLSDGVEINTIESGEDFCASYCEKHGYTYELIPDPEPEPEYEPTQLDIIEAQVTYTAMMTNTLLEAQ